MAESVKVVKLYQRLDATMSFLANGKYNEIEELVLDNQVAIMTALTTILKAVEGAPEL